MRVSTNSVLRNYRTNLGSSINNLNIARTKVMTERKFNRLSEDPSSGVRSLTLRRQYMKNDDYLESLKNTQAEYDAANASQMEISNMLKEIKGTILEGVDGATSIEERKTFATSLRKMQESILMSINSKFGDKYLLGGAETNKPPFAIDPVTGGVTFNGVDVDSTDPAAQAFLKRAAEESLYVDLGFGLDFDNNGEIVKGSAFDSAISGLNILGFGTNDDGISKNLISLLGSMANELEQPTLDSDKFKLMMKQFDVNTNQVTDSLAVLGTKSKFLENTAERLEDNKITLNEKLVDVDKVDMADAITEYSWAQYVYNAALKVGTSILSPSFIDFMK